MDEKVCLVVPTFNAASLKRNIFCSVKEQLFKPHYLLVIDSSSTDGTVKQAEEEGFSVYTIPQHQFSHGSTRQLGVEILKEAGVMIFATQDAVLANPESLKLLAECFLDKCVGAAYGRQLPHFDADPIHAHARLFNYPSVSRISSMKDVGELGLKTAFISNSFAAYRKSALMQVGGFPDETIFGEDMCVAGKMLLAGWKIKYCSEAQVYHSHNYSFIEEFKRYFDIGVLHSNEKWLQDSFGKAEGAGRRFLISELNYLLNKSPLLLPSAFLRNILKYTAYKLGFVEKTIPLRLKTHLSMNRNYWKQDKKI